MATLEEILSPIPPDSPPCLLCGNGLSEHEISLNQKWHFSCNKCHYCGNGPLSFEVIEKALEGGLKPSHTSCYDRQMEQEYKIKPVTITQEMLDWHNERRLIFDINAQMTVNANQVMAATNFRNSRWIHELDLDSLFLVMKRLEAIAAEASILLDESKKKDKVKKDREAKDKGLIKESFENHVSDARAKEIKRNRFTPEEKAIKAMMTIGLNREQAIEELTKQKIKGIMKSQNCDETKAREILENGQLN